MHERQRCAEIEPVAAINHSAHHGVVCQQTRKGLTLDRHHPTRGDLLDDRTGEDVAPGIDQVGDDLFRRRRLLQKGLDSTVAIDRNQAVRAGVLYRGQVQRDITGGLHVRAHECIDVQTAEDVSVKDDNGIVGSGLQV